MSKRAASGPPTEVDLSQLRPHAGQLKVIQSCRDFEVTCVSPGRRWGKSSTRFLVCVDWMLRNQTLKWSEIACGAQDHATAAEIWDRDRVTYGSLVLDGKNEDQRRYLDVIGLVDEAHPKPKGFMTRIWYPALSAEAHGRFQGKGLQFAVLDEMSWIPSAAWYLTIEPMLTDTGGHALMYGTPIPGAPHFAEWRLLCLKGTPGLKDRDPKWSYFTGPSWENPYGSVAVKAKEKYDALMKRGEIATAMCLYRGQFVSDLGAVFSNLDAVFVLPGHETRPFTLEYRRPLDGESVVLGLDLGKHNDPTVAAVFSIDTMEMLAVMRLVNMDYSVQMGHIDQMVRDFNRPILMADAREGGSALIEVLRQKYGDHAIGVKWSRGGKWDKGDSIVRAQDLFQTAAWKMIDVDWLREEFQLYSKEALPSGGWKYGAPPGAHDDGVAACCYAAYQLPLVGKVIETHAPKIEPWSDEFWRACEDTQIRPQLDRPYSLRRRAI